MVAVNVADLTARFPDLLDHLSRGEQVEIVQDGKAVAQLSLTPDAPLTPVENVDDDDDEDAPRPWRGVFADLPPANPIPGFKLPDEPLVLERRPIEPNLNFLPDRGDDDE